jgi:hypothetical protein
VLVHQAAGSDAVALLIAAMCAAAAAAAASSRGTQQTATCKKELRMRLKRYQNGLQEIKAGEQQHADCTPCSMDAQQVMQLSMCLPAYSQ